MVDGLRHKRPVEPKTIACVILCSFSSLFHILEQVIISGFDYENDVYLMSSITFGASEITQ